MSQFYQGVTSGALPPAVPLQFTTDSGIAVPANNNLNVLGSGGATTSGAGSTLTITVSEIPGNYVNVVGPTTYTVLSTDYFISCNTSGGVITIELLDAPAANQRFVVKDRTGNSATNNVTVTTVSGLVTIDGSTSVLLDDPYDSIEVLFNGTSYEIF